MVDVITTPPVEYSNNVAEPRIYVVNYLPYVRAEDVAGLTQIYAGKSASTAPPHELTDRLLVSPSLPNERWSELSAIYKIWREGPKSDVVGFCHYRRFFNFSDERYRMNINNITKEEFLSIKSSLFDRSQVDQVSDSTSIIAPQLFLKDTVYKWYAQCHIASDYLDVFKLVALQRPEILPFMVLQFDRITMYGSNLFIMSWKNFNELCQFWFQILHQFTEGVEWPRGSEYQNLDVVFLAERLFDAWIRWKAADGHTVSELPILFVEGLRLSRSV